MTQDQATAVLLEMVKSNDRANRDAHEDIKKTIELLGQSLCRKIDEIRGMVTQHIEEQDQLLALRAEQFKEEVTEAKHEVLAEVTAPGPLKVAGRMMVHGLNGCLNRMGFLLGLFATVVIILEKLHVIG